MEEKRQFFRAKRPILVYYQVKGDSAPAKASETKDISSGGMCFVSARPFDKDTVLSIEIHLPISHDQIDACGKVIESQLIGEGKGYNTRLAFVDTDPISLIRLQREIT
ncbi:MAG: PilZ domain-containing protein [Candidatus Omnitrophica bacterium]|nr:PilZ domain-containing protein [Candidatus Omnitrophota bacterium]HOX54927.1 PilZ domain-containing protein [Candidatus Omnitrophota bacterium]